MTGATRPSLRERKKAETRELLQRQALAQFLAKGYDATTVEEIAAAAGVSHMTFFRYFPTKEDVILADDYDALIVEQIVARPADESVIEKVGRAFHAALAVVYPVAREGLLVRTRLILRTPQLRARLWEQTHTTERILVDALAGAENGAADLRVRVLAAVCLAAVTTALLLWAEESDGKENETRELPDLIDQVFAVLRREMSETHD